jgi:hypothetical protein
MKKKGPSTIKSSPKAGIDVKAPEGEVHTDSQIKPKDSPAVEESKISEIGLSTAGQRTINLIWETTQARIAVLSVAAGFLINIMVILIVLLVAAEITVNQIAVISVCLQFINLSVGIIIGFYFSRTNHAAIGGVGTKPVQQYEGR